MGLAEKSSSSLSARGEDVGAVSDQGALGMQGGISVSVSPHRWGASDTHAPPAHTGITSEDLHQTHGGRIAAHTGLSGGIAAHTGLSGNIAAHTGLSSKDVYQTHGQGLAAPPGASLGASPGASHARRMGESASHAWRMGEASHSSDFHLELASPFMDDAFPVQATESASHPRYVGQQRTHSSADLDLELASPFMDTAFPVQAGNVFDQYGNLGERGNQPHYLPHVPGGSQPHHLPHAPAGDHPHYLPHAPGDDQPHYLPHVPASTQPHHLPHAPGGSQPHYLPHAPGGDSPHYLTHAPGGRAAGQPDGTVAQASRPALSGKASAYEVPSKTPPSESREEVLVHATSAGDAPGGVELLVHATSVGDVPGGVRILGRATSARDVPGGVVSLAHATSVGDVPGGVEILGRATSARDAPGGVVSLAHVTSAGGAPGGVESLAHAMSAGEATGGVESLVHATSAGDVPGRFVTNSHASDGGFLPLSSSMGTQEGQEGGPGGRGGRPARLLGKASAFEVEEEAGGKLWEPSQKLHLHGPTSEGSEDVAVEGASARARAVRACGCIWDSGTACILLSAAIQAVSALCVKQMGDRVPVTQIVVVRSLICFAMSVPIARASNIRPLFGLRKYWPSLWPRALVGTIAMSLYYVAVQHLPLADAMTIFFSNPAITAVLSWAIHREPLGLISCAGIAASLGGVTLVTQPPFLFGGHDNWDQSRFIGVMMGIASSACSAVAYILIRFIPNAVPSLVVALWFHTAGIVSMGIPLLVGYPESPVLPNLLDNVRLVIIGTTSFAVQLLINRAFRLESASKMATMSLTQVLYGHIFGVTLLGDRESLLSIFGTGLIAFGVVTVSLGHKRRAPSLNDNDEETQPLHASDPEKDRYEDGYGRSEAGGITGPGGKTDASGRSGFAAGKSEALSKSGFAAGPGVLLPLWEGPEGGGRGWRGEDAGGWEAEPLFGPQRRRGDRADFEAARGPVAF